MAILATAPVLPNAILAARRLGQCAIAVALLLSSGCGTFRDLREGVAVCLVVRGAERRHLAGNQPEFGQSRHYRDGWRRGYRDVAQGGNGAPPVVPPKKYWQPVYVDRDCSANMQAWYRGYSCGASAAQHDGVQAGYFVTTIGQAPQTPTDTLSPLEAIIESSEDVEGTPVNEQLPAPQAALPNISRAPSDGNMPPAMSQRPISPGERVPVGAAPKAVGGGISAKVRTAERSWAGAPLDIQQPLPTPSLPQTPTSTVQGVGFCEAGASAIPYRSGAGALGAPLASSSPPEANDASDRATKNTLTSGHDHWRSAPPSGRGQ